MALSGIERKRIETTVGAFVEKRRPAPHIRPKLDFGFGVSGQSVELLEIRPQADRPEVKRESAFAKASFARSRGVWKLYRTRADPKRHSDGPAAQVAGIDRFLAVVKEDEYGCAFG
ncbi:MAG: DUF3024 domain-containing protein [Burkholderiales bacterium]|nr:DUF3024 domain-containing protein [Burkholderiales bacterium]